MVDINDLTPGLYMLIDKDGWQAVGDWDGKDFVLTRSSTGAPLTVWRLRHVIGAERVGGAEWPKFEYEWRKSTEELIEEALKPRPPVLPPLGKTTFQMPAPKPPKDEEMDSAKERAQEVYDQHAEDEAKEVEDA